VTPNLSPILNICDLDLLKDVLVRDFDHFVNRTSIFDFFGKGTTKYDKVKIEQNISVKELMPTDVQIWHLQLSNIKEEEWKDVRSTLTPIFTSGKLKLMTVFINQVSRKALNMVTQAAKNDQGLDFKEVFSKYSMDSIASCAFGIEAGSFRPEETEFEKYAKSAFTK